MMRYGRLSWNSKFKWFGTEEFVQSRVRDGKFNNSKFVADRYKHLVKFEVITGIEHFSKFGNREFMLSVRKAPLVKIKIIGEVDS
jgi:hypothetical protein